MHRDHHANERRDFLRDPRLGGAALESHLVHGSHVADYKVHLFRAFLDVIESAAHVAPVHQVERQLARG